MRSTDPDAAGVLGFVLERRRRQDAAAAEEMAGILAWANLHRVAPGEMVSRGALDPAVRQAAYADDSVAADLGREGELRLGGDGAALVSEFALTELAAALGMSETAARHLVGQSVELAQRLPRLWDQVQAGRVPAWKARQIAKQTIRLNAEAATYVDAQLAPFAARLSLTRIERAVDAAILWHDPDLAAERSEQAAENRGVWTEDHIDGTSEINAILDTPDAVAFDAALNQVASTLGDLGDPNPHQVRRAKAYGVLADPQHALHLTSESAAGGGTGTGPTESGGGPVIHVHLHTTTDDDLEAAPVEPVARIDRFGARSLDAVQRWITGLAPGSTIKLTPVVDLTERIAVDAYEIPDRLRHQITERDLGCQFPWCGRAGRHDLDHIDEYVPLDEGGPPGQTSTEKLARGCRFHHRVKTHSDWTYRRNPDGSLTWTSPLGRRYRVDHTGTSTSD